jgi:hypothetical protein
MRSTTVAIFLFAAALAKLGAAGELSYSVQQITSGPKHHFFGYIGHVQNIPWSADGRYLVVLRTEFQDHLPKADEAAEIVLLDARNNFAPAVVDRTRAWNPQQGTMLYWNPSAAATQFFFNDRDPATGKVFAVLYDIESRRRLREYKFDDTPIGNSGVSQAGGYFLGLNYGRLARLRPVTGYPEAFDWTVGRAATKDDGIFRVDVATGEKNLLVSFARLADTLAARNVDVEGKHLFINHTLTSRDGRRVYFFVRADFGSRTSRVNVPFTVNADGGELVAHDIFMGGHPEWDGGSRIIGRQGKNQAIYDVVEKRIVGTIGTPEMFPDPEGDIALSPDGKWFVNGYRVKNRNYYAILNRETGDFVRTEGFDCEGWTRGDLRLDAAPCWNRTSTQLLVPGIASDKSRSRQLFVISIKLAQ